jgi:hypothetical protein
MGHQPGNEWKAKANNSHDKVVPTSRLSVAPDKEDWNSDDEESQQPSPEQLMGSQFEDEVKAKILEGRVLEIALREWLKEKQKEIEGPKQQNQQYPLTLKDLKELKRQPSPTQIPKSALPMPRGVRQAFMPVLKPPASLGQLQLQDQLIVACKQGDEKAVNLLLQQGAKPDLPDAKGEQPLGAAVWGMCPNMVNALLKQAGGGKSRNK